MQMIFIVCNGLSGGLGRNPPNEIPYFRGYSSFGMIE